MRKILTFLLLISLPAVAFLLGSKKEEKAPFQTYESASNVNVNNSYPSPRPCICPSPVCLPQKITIPAINYQGGKLRFYNTDCYPEECYNIIKQSYDNMIREQQDALLNSPLFRR